MQKQQVSLSKVKYSIFRIIWWSLLEKSNHKFSYTDFLSGQMKKTWYCAPISFRRLGQVLVLLGIAAN
jgi:hypothetical protein